MKKVIPALLLSAVLLFATACVTAETSPEQETKITGEETTAVKTQDNMEITTKQTAEPDIEAPQITSYDYTYDEIVYWDYNNMKAVMKTQAKSTTDFEAFIHSPEGRDCIVNMVNSGIYGDLEGTGTRLYWEKLGMKVELHDADDENRQWATYTPLSAENEPERKYPVLFVWHGSTNSIALAQFYGFVELAAEREWIVVIPWAANDAIYLDETDRIMEILRTDYPIDESRIYTTGFSLGGRTSAHLAQERSEIFAAAAPCGVAADAHFYTGTNAELHWSADTLSDLPWFADGVIAQEEIDAAIPVQFFGAVWDPTGAMPYNHEDKVEAVNLWLQLYGHEASQDYSHSKELLESATEDAEGATGLSFDRSYTEERYGELNYIGDFKTGDVCRFRVVCSANGIHWPTKAMCEYVVEFLEQFSKEQLP